MNGVYLEVAKKSFQKRFVYRTNSYLNIFGALILLLIQISLWSSLIGFNGNIDGISFQDMFNYIVINTVILSLVQTNAGRVLAQKVRDGSIAIDFVRPINLKYYLFSEDIGDNMYRTLFCVLPVCIVSVIIFGFKAPAGMYYLLMFILSMVSGVIIIYYINYIFGLLSFWLKTSWYVSWYSNALFTLFGGTFVPIWFYPDFLRIISNVLPFRLVTFEPISIYLGKQTELGSVKVILYQLLWISILIAVEKIVWKKAQDKIIIQGG